MRRNYHPSMPFPWLGGGRMGRIADMSAPASATAPRDLVAAPPLPVTPFRRLFGPGEYAYTRIPVLSALQDGTLLAAVEARRGSGGDWAETHLLMRRSSDGGAGWSD